MSRKHIIASWRVALLCVVFAQSSLLAAEDARVTFDFEKDTETWKPRADSITVTHDKRGFAPDSTGQLHVQGRIEGGWNYAMSDPQPIQPGRLYRLAAYVLVDKLGQETPPTYLKCEFHPEQQTGRPDDGGFLFEGKSAVLRLEPLTPDAVQVDAEPLAIEGRHGEKDLTMLTVRLARTAAQWQNVVAFSWAPTGQQVKRVAMETQGDVTTFRCGHRVVSLDWSSPGATLEE